MSALNYVFEVEGEDTKAADEDGYAPAGAYPNLEPVVARSSGGGDDGDRTYMGNSKRRADFFLYPSKTLGINHGHAGMFAYRNIIVEAASMEQGVMAVMVYNRASVPARATGIFKVTTAGKSARGDAGDWAINKNGADYRPVLQQNKTTSAPYNCAQLVWAAYAKQNRWIDGNGGNYVYPWNLRDDPATFLYRIY